MVSPRWPKSPRGPTACAAGDTRDRVQAHSPLSPLEAESPIICLGDAVYRYSAQELCNRLDDSRRSSLTVSSDK